MSEPVPEREAVTDQLLNGLRLAVTIIAVAVLASASLPRKLGHHDPLWPQTTAYLVLGAILLVEGVLLAKRRSWGWWRVPALMATLGASALSAWFLAPGDVLTAADWSFGTTSWVLLVLLSGQRFGVIVVFLAAHASTTLLRAAVLGPSDMEFLLRFLAAAVSTMGFPLATGVATAVLRSIAERAHEATEEAGRIRTQEALAEEVQKSRRQRFDDIHDSAEPLLRGLADGSLTPGDPDVRRRCGVEAARMRRLFAETDVVADRLIHELRNAADYAERNGVVVELGSVGSWPTPEVPVRRALTDGPLAVLHLAKSTAAITVIGTKDELVVQVRVDGVAGNADDIPEPAHPDVRQRVHADGETLWIEVRWPTGA